MSDLVDRARRATRRTKAAAQGSFARPVSDVDLAAHHDRVRGYDRPRAERSKEAYELADSLPVVNWTPPALRPQM